MSSGDVSGVVKSGSNTVSNIISTTTTYVSKHKTMFIVLSGIVVFVIVLGLYYDCSKNCSQGKKNKLVSMLDHLISSDDSKESKESKESKDSDSKSDESSDEDDDNDNDNDKDNKSSSSKSSKSSSNSKSSSSK